MLLIANVGVVGENNKESQTIEKRGGGGTGNDKKEKKMRKNQNKRQLSGVVNNVMQEVGKERLQEKQLGTR